MTTKRANRLFWPASATDVMLLVAACKPGALPASINAGQPSEATQSLPATQDTSQGGIVGPVEAMEPTAWTISGKVFEVTAQTRIKDTIQVGDVVKANVEPGTSRLEEVSLAADPEDVNDNANGNDAGENENINDNENENDDDETVNENENENENDNEAVNENENENEDGGDDNENVNDNGNGDHEDDGGDHEGVNGHGNSGHDGGEHDGGDDHEGGDDD
jgi:hypothetical protein